MPDESHASRSSKSAGFDWSLPYPSRRQPLFARSFREVAGRAVCIDLSQAHFWDITAVAALHKVRQRLAKHGSTVQLQGLNAHSQGLMERLAVRD